MEKAWNGFNGGQWQEAINVRDFIQANVQPYTGDASFVAGPTGKSTRLWQRCLELLAQERKKDGVLDVDTHTVSTIDVFGPGYIEKDNEVIFGLQTDAPLKRSLIVNGGIRMAEQAAEAYGYKVDEKISDIYHNHAVTHNEAVFNAYTEEMREVRSLGILTGLPDAYGRGRIIGDYRRVALYGVQRLIAEKERDLHERSGLMSEATIRLREEINKQIASLKALLRMGASYGFDLSQPAQNAREAVQWLYFAYLSSIKEQNGAAMSFGRTATFLDIYIERDLENGVLTEQEAQELVDQLMIKLRMARHLRTPEYNDLFAGDPLWVTEVLGGMGEDGRTLVSKNSFRYLQSLYNLGPAPEPNLTVLWSEALPDGFKSFCAQVSLDTSSIQYENDDVMRPIYGDDYGIACCVSAMRLGKDMQFFGARANLAKALLLSINGGRDEVTGRLVVPNVPLLPAGKLQYEAVRANYSQVLAWLANVYVNTLNVIHYMHDKYAYESIQMALHDSNVHRYLACGVAGLSVAVDSLSAIRYGGVTPKRNEQGLAVSFEADGPAPCFGNDDDRADALATELTHEFIGLLRQTPTYREAEHTLSVLTITSNVMYGKKTGATPDGRLAGAPFAPGANPMHGRDQHGALAAMRSLAKISYDDCRDGISYTFSILPATLGKTKEQKRENLVSLLDGYASLGGHHINVNVMDRSVLEAAMKEPEKYPQLTIRVSGYAVHFIRLTREQQKEVLQRTFYQAL